ncbi:TM2 domain-containing protein [Streptomyces sp. URMC 123]|uniref:TM2 domain-containing protein n=1 Tax=Streptomyces sp. URMC 123 TaxID=3423403 RepID=UPI003F1C7673
MSEPNPYAKPQQPQQPPQPQPPQGAAYGYPQPGQPQPGQAQYGQPQPGQAQYGQPGQAPQAPYGYPQPGYGYPQPAPAAAPGMPPYGYDPSAPYGYDPYGRPYSDKSKVAAGMLSLFLGGFGVGRFYTGHVGLALGQLFTCGGLGIWSLIDAIVLLSSSNATDAQGRVLRG